MKWLLYLLILANAAFFAWQYQLREASRATSEAREAARPAYVTRLVMLSEVGRGGTTQGPAESAGEGPGSTHVAEPASESAGGGAVAAVHNGAQAPLPAGAAHPDAGLPSQEAPTPPDRAAAVPTTANPPPEAVPEPPAPPSPPPADAVAHEPAPIATPATAAPVTEVPVTEVPAPARRHCYGVGPLAEDAPVDPVRAWLVQQGAQVHSRVEQRQEPRSFWVYIPPAASAAAARETADRLQADGVKDVMRMTAGAMANAISLGLYNRRAAADQRVAELKRAGYSAEVETRFKEVRETWLDATFEAPRDLPREGFRAAFPQLKAAASGCR